MSLTGFVGFLSTQSNVIAAVENGTARLEDVLPNLEEGAAKFFHADRELFAFEISINVLRRVDS